MSRRQPPPGLRAALLAALGAALTLAVIGLVDEQVDLALMSVGFGASAVLVFALPETPVAQPASVVGGQVVATSVGLLMSMLTPLSWWSLALAVGLAIFVMLMLRVTHPPAAANTVGVMLVSQSWWYLLVPILAGAVFIVLAGVLWHRLTGKRYPMPAPQRRADGASARR